MRMLAITIVVANLVFFGAVGTAGAFDTDFTEEDVARAVEIAEIRYGDPEADREEQRLRAIELFPPFDADTYRRQPNTISDPEEIRAAFLALQDHQQALRFLSHARTHVHWMDAEVVSRIYQLADDAPDRHHRTRFLRHAAAGHAWDGDLGAAWSATIESMWEMSPDTSLVRTHDALCRPFTAGRTPNERSQLHFFKTRAREYPSYAKQTETPECANGAESPCPVCRDTELAERIDVARSLTKFSSREDQAAEWLSATLEIARGFNDPADSLLIEAASLLRVLYYGDLNPALREESTLRLRDVALALRDDPDGLRIAADAAGRFALVSGLENDAARLLDDVIASGKPYPYGLNSEIQRIQNTRPEVARALYLEIVSGEAPDEVPCWAMSGLTSLDPDSSRARGWKIQLARGLCDPGHETWNGSVEQARRELIKEYLAAGDTRRAFAVQALHHYRSFCGTGAQGARRAIHRRLAEFQIAADLDTRGAARAYLQRAEQLERETELQLRR